jgi:DNA-directed RNA polymerase subunit H (RpoH/RPB5)
MDINYLYKFGLVLTNLRNLLRDRCYDTKDLDKFIKDDDPIETFSEVYAKAKLHKISFSDALKFEFVSTEKTLSIWFIDRNYDQAKLRERMTSTDQIKAVNEDIDKCLSDYNIIICASKCSPQAKKEVSSKAQLFIFDELLIDLPRHILVSRHSIVSEAEAKKYLGLSFEPKDLPRILITDPVAKWYNWSINQIVFIDNPVMPKFKIVSN